SASKTVCSATGGMCSGNSVAMRRVAIPASTEFPVQAAKELLERARELAALGLAQFFLLAGQPCDLDHASLALKGQMAVKGIVAALEYREFAVQWYQLRCDHAVDVIDAVQETQAAIAGIRPLGIEIDQRGGDLRLAVGMDGAAALVQQAAQGHQGRVVVEVLDAQTQTDGASKSRGRHVLDKRVDAGTAVTRVVRKEAGAGITREVAIDVSAHFVGQLAVGHHEREGMLLHRGVRAVEARGIEQYGGTHGIFSSFEITASLPPSGPRQRIREVPVQPT